MKTLLSVTIFFSLSFAAQAAGTWAILNTIELVDTKTDTLKQVKIRTSHLKDSDDAKFACKFAGHSYGFHFPYVMLSGKNHLVLEIGSRRDQPNNIHAFFLMDISADKQYAVTMHAGNLDQEQLDKIPEIKRDGVVVNGYECF
jgi:hypothetical protein